MSMKSGKALPGGLRSPRAPGIGLMVALGKWGGIYIDCDTYLRTVHDESEER